MKRTVHYKSSEGALNPHVGNTAVVWPLDHPDTSRVSNTGPVITSTVVKINDDGSFETLNSIYVPA